jgi:hypothetical protein
MSHAVDVSIAVVGMAELLAAIVEAGLQYDREKEFRTEDGTVHGVDFVVTDEQGTRTGVKVDSRSGEARFVGHDGGAGSSSAVARRVAQRYAYSRALQQLKEKGYEIAKEERQADGSIRIVAQRWR